MFLWYFLDLRSYSKQFQLCILNIFHQKQLFFVGITELDLSWRRDHDVGSNDLNCTLGTPILHVCNLEMALYSKKPLVI